MVAHPWRCHYLAQNRLSLLRNVRVFHDPHSFWLQLDIHTTHDQELFALVANEQPTLLRILFKLWDDVPLARQPFGSVPQCKQTKDVGQETFWDRIAQRERWSYPPARRLGESRFDTCMTWQDCDDTPQRFGASRNQRPTKTYAYKIQWSRPRGKSLADAVPIRLRELEWMVKHSTRRIPKVTTTRRWPSFQKRSFLVFFNFERCMKRSIVC